MFSSARRHTYPTTIWTNNVVMLNVKTTMWRVHFVEFMLLILAQTSISTFSSKLVKHT